MGIIAENDVQLVLSRMQVVEQTLGVNRPAGPGDGNDDFQGGKIRAQYGGANFIQQARFAGAPHLSFLQGAWGLSGAGVPPICSKPELTGRTPMSLALQ